MIYLQLFIEFFKTGLFSIGGGLATLPFLYDIAARYPWFTETDLSDMIAVSESTPGPIGVNMSTFAGYKAAGLPGAVFATFSLVLPSVIVIVLIARALERFRENRYVQYALAALRPASVGLVAAAVLSVLQVALINTEALAVFDWSQVILWKSLLLFAVLFAVYQKFNKLHPIVIIALGAAAGILVGF